MTNDREQGKARDDLKMAMEAYAGEKLAVAFSGGVDSSLLLHLACAYAKDPSSVHAVILKTMLQTEEEVQKAREAAIEMGATAWVLSVDDWEEAGILDNPPERCYLCKKHMFQRLREHMAEHGVTVILEGTNADDLQVYRPGIRAIRELGIKSPLAEAGMTKETVRAMAQEYGIGSAKKPSAPCLATRFPYGTRLTREKLRMAELGEAYLNSLGMGNVRLRVHGEIARIEVDSKDFFVLVKNREDVVSHLKELGYRYVTLDLQGFRSGSMDE